MAPEKVYAMDFDVNTQRDEINAPLQPDDLSTFDVLMALRTGEPLR